MEMLVGRKLLFGQFQAGQPRQHKGAHGLRFTSKANSYQWFAYLLFAAVARISPRRPGLEVSATGS